MAHQLDKTYDPKSFEERLYKGWEEKGYFKPSDDKSKKPFCIVIPPPNVTGQLHMGHALNNTLQDIIIRTKRMQGYNALWIPGTDHAGIATQIKVEENLRKTQGLSKYDVGREEFLKLVWDWKNKFGNRIIDQLKKLGSSCDWSRERFTMDETCSKAVKRTFVSLYKSGLIYRGYRIINWCPNCKTALSDTEVEHIDLAGNFWHIRYPIDGTDDYLEIATTRPETMLGDTAVAVNPEDERYTHLVGKMLILPLVGRKIPVIADEYVDKEFGTGCVKITPCHDPNDFEVGKRHDLEMIEILNGDGTINENGGIYQGMDRFAARKKIVEDLDALGLLVEVRPHTHPVAHCYRCNTVVEPMSSRQWFVSMKPLAAPAIDVVKSGEIQYIPARFSKNYLNWMENIQDWCISRQLWWGHRIPAYYCDDCGAMMVEEEAVTVCPKCNSKNVRQEEDVLDTWFSSALWPFSTLGWPDSNEDLSYYYPTNVLVTAYDIITFWVSKMIFQGLNCMKEIPFPKVFIHGLVRDAQGRKMSKSLGNGIDPLEVVDQFGADALRFTLATGNSPGNDMRFSYDRVESSRNFANKLWNAARFILMNLSIDEVVEPDESTLTTEDKWILTRFNELVETVTVNIEKYELGIAVSKLYDFIWDIFCDWYIELIKPRLFDKESAQNLSAQNTIAYIFTGTLKLLHPFMPFITEEIFRQLPHKDESIMISAWPSGYASSYPEDAERFEKVIAAIRAIRNRRSEMNVQPSKKTSIFIETATPAIFEGTEIFFRKLAFATEVSIVPANTRDDTVAIPTDAATFHIPLAEMIDIEKERARLLKEKEQVAGEIARVSAKLENESFISRAPEKIVNIEKDKLKKYSDMLTNIEQALAKLS